MLVCDYYKATQYDVVSKGLISALSQEDYWLYIDTVLSIHPDAKEALLKYMYDSNTFVPYSIFVAKKNFTMSSANLSSPCSSNWKTHKGS